MKPRKQVSPRSNAFMSLFPSALTSVQSDFLALGHRSDDNQQRLSEGDAKSRGVVRSAGKVLRCLKAREVYCFRSGDSQCFECRNSAAFN
jgi:hypothetical protein